MTLGNEHMQKLTRFCTSLSVLLVTSFVRDSTNGRPSYLSSSGERGNMTYDKFHRYSTECAQLFIQDSASLRNFVAHGQCRHELELVDLDVNLLGRVETRSCQLEEVEDGARGLALVPVVKLAEHLGHHGEKLHQRRDISEAAGKHESGDQVFRLPLYTSIALRIQVTSTYIHGHDVVTHLTPYSQHVPRSTVDYVYVTLVSFPSLEPDVFHQRVYPQELYLEACTTVCTEITPTEGGLDFLRAGDVCIRFYLHCCSSRTETRRQNYGGCPYCLTEWAKCLVGWLKLHLSFRRILMIPKTDEVASDMYACTTTRQQMRTIRETDVTNDQEHPNYCSDRTKLHLYKVRLTKPANKFKGNCKERTTFLNGHFLDVVILSMIILHSILVKNQLQRIRHKDALQDIHAFFSGDSGNEHTKKLGYELKSDSDNMLLLPLTKDTEETGIFSKLAGQWSVVVRPLTRFLPDTTNNPALDLAHVGYRLATLSALPPSVPVSRVQLADAGFYYRGQGDEMICYSCHTRYSGWTSQDKPMEVHRRISPDCPHVVERDRPLSAPTGTSSVPAAPSGVQQQLARHRQGNSSSEISSSRVIESSLRESHIEDGENTQTGASVVTNPSDTARRVLGAAASSYSGRPTSSSGTQETTPPVSSSSSLTPSRPAASSSSACGDQGTAPRRLGLLGGALDAADGRAQGSEEGAATRQMFPRAGLDLGGAVYPMYQDMASRRRSFPHWDDRRAPPLDQMILCGMFYAGYADCVRCFYCGVGLKHWEVTDDVWVEHVRWRPSCGYLRSVKGDNYITRTLARLGREAGGEGDDDGGPGDGQDRRDGDIRPGNSRAASAGRPGRQQDREQQLRRAPPVRPQANVTSSSSSSSGANPTSGSSTSTARTNGRTSNTGTTSSAASPATSAVSSPTSCNSQSGARPEGGASTSAARSEESQSQRVARLQAENRELARRLRCKVCVTEPIDTILMPCGHLVVCETCARNVTQCPLCHDRIRATAKVHMN
ncbi:hypothetical protein BaRGS_00015647 [Batillaria attramentaria]|uniref:RING-type domain-containing protein n=1 Tax=Batillaria attramentaria TaxID=370345 RepID=A0ABD0L1A0_9CAEN